MSLNSIVAKFLSGRRSPGPIDPLIELREIVDAGLIYEDQFIMTYLRILRDEGFLEYFGADAAKARSILTALIDESTAHKATLDAIMTKIS